MQQFLELLPLHFQWTIHNLVGHPVSECLHLVGLDKASKFVHDRTAPNGKPLPTDRLLASHDGALLVPISIDRIVVDAQAYRTSPALVLDVSVGEGVDEQPLFLASDEERPQCIEMLSWANTYDELLGEAEGDLRFLVREYLLENPDKLAPDAIRLQNTMRARFKKEAENV